MSTPSFSDPKLDSIFARNDEHGDGFNSLLEKARSALGISNWRDTTGQKDEGFVVEASDASVANELAAAREHAREQIKFWTAQKAAAEDVIKDAITAVAEERFPDEENAPKNITFKANNVVVATFNRSADSRGIDSAKVKALFPDTPDNSELWKTTAGSRRLLIK